MVDYKFREGELIKEFKQYIDSTYDQHYAEDKFQATEFVIDGGHGTGFCIGNVLKYAQRYGKKGTPLDHRKDLMKVLHYTLIQLYIHDEEVASEESWEKELLATQFKSDHVSIDNITPEEWNESNKKFLTAISTSGGISEDSIKLANTAD